jgi:sugar phosphate isomerase/epimerase
MDRSPSSVAESLRRAGLRCTSVQLNPVTDVDSLAAAAEVVGFEHVTTSLFKLPDGMQVRGGENMAEFLVRATTAMTTDDWKRSAAELNALGKALKARGLKFSYHNHNHEFAPRGDSPRGYDLLMAETDPALVSFELDVGWAKAAGPDPAELLRTHGSRFALLHLKDVAAGTPANFAFKQSPADVGDGVQDWVGILQAAHGVGIRQFFVEREPPFTAPRLESARRSFNFLNRLQA